MCETRAQEVERLLSFQCPVPGCAQVLGSRGEAVNHVRDRHDVFLWCGGAAPRPWPRPSPRPLAVAALAAAAASSVCVENRKVFFREHKVYTRPQLTKHFRQGRGRRHGARGAG